MLVFFVACCLVLSTGVVSSESQPSVVSPTATVNGNPTSPSDSSDPGGAAASVAATTVETGSVNGAATPTPSGGISVNGNGNGNGNDDTNTPSEIATLIEPMANLTVVNGSCAELSCVARTDGRNVVIVWLQSDEFKVLFYGSSRVTEDKRLSVRLLVEDGKTESTLRISPVLDIDQSKYICRLPRKEKIYTESMFLTVVPAEPKTNGTSTTDSTELPSIPTSPPPQLTSSESSSSSSPLVSATTTFESTTPVEPLREDSSTMNPDLAVTSR